MFYKIIIDGMIVDVITEREISYVKEDAYSGRLLMAKKNDPGIIGFLSSDMGTVYATVAHDKYQFVDVVECFNDNEYDDLKSEIDEQRSVVYEPVEETVDISALKIVLAQQQAEQLMGLLQTVTNDLSDELIIKYPAFVEKWEEGKSYEAGKRLSYDGCVYKVTKSIGTSGATPDNSTAYYTKLN